MAEECTCPACGVKVRLVYSFTGFIIGLSVFIVFGIKYENWNAALWGLISGLAALGTFFLHLWYDKKKCQDRMPNLKLLMLTGCFIQLAGVVGFAVYLALAVTLDQGLIIQGPGYYLTTVWCFMTWKWGFSFFFFSRMYRRQTLNSYEEINEV
ncbi:heme transporter hrg1-A-like [Mytilus galloprovincialis]|uniref:heme transporter hrg1-A-like n=1 Tax=Mytilus galloprovincialis TaxID=29158 RepID=UPI003F7C72F0